MFSWNDSDRPASPRIETPEQAKLGQRRRLGGKKDWQTLNERSRCQAMIEASLRGCIPRVLLEGYM
jgi:hypothetical protein